MTDVERFAFTPTDDGEVTLQEAAAQWRHAAADRGLTPVPDTAVIAVLADDGSLSFIEGEVTHA